MWRAVPQLLSRTIIETPLNLLDHLRRQARKRAVLGQVLTDQRIGVLDVWLVRRAVGARKGKSWRYGYKKHVLTDEQGLAEKSGLRNGLSE